METADAAARATSATLDRSRAAIVTSSGLQVLASGAEHLSYQSRNTTSPVASGVLASPFTSMARRGQDRDSRQAVSRFIPICTRASTPFITASQSLSHQAPLMDIGELSPLHCHWARDVPNRLHNNKTSYVLF